MGAHEDTAARIGRGMAWAAWLLLLALLTWFFHGYLERARNPNQTVATTVEGGVPQVVLQRNRSGHYVATALLNGVPVEVLLDTGATTVAVPEGLARELGLRFGVPLQLSTANGTATGYATRLDSVQIGDIAVRDVAAAINPRGREVLLGMSFLKHLEFTQRGDTLTLRPYRD